MSTKPTNRTIAVLEPLVGAWTMKITWSEKTHKLVGGPQSIESPSCFEWIVDGGFLHQAAGESGAPVAHWMIGRDETSGAFAALYADSRGVERLYEMSFADGLWKLWRSAPGFHQRFEGRLCPDGKTIEGKWERSEDGSNWELDFKLIFVKTQ